MAGGSEQDAPSRADRVPSSFVPIARPGVEPVAAEEPQELPQQMADAAAVPGRMAAVPKWR